MFSNIFLFLGMMPSFLGAQENPFPLPEPIFQEFDKKIASSHHHLQAGIELVQESACPEETLQQWHKEYVDILDEAIDHIDSYKKLLLTHKKKEIDTFILSPLQGYCQTLSPVFHTLFTVMFFYMKEKKEITVHRDTFKQMVAANRSSIFHLLTHSLTLSHLYTTKEREKLLLFIEYLSPTDKRTVWLKVNLYLHHLSLPPTPPSLLYPHLKNPLLLMSTKLKLP